MPIKSIFKNHDKLFQRLLKNYFSGYSARGKTV